MRREWSPRAGPGVLPRFEARFPRGAAGPCRPDGRFRLDLDTRDLTPPLFGGDPV